MYRARRVYVASVRGEGEKKNAPFWDAERLFRLGNCGDGGVAEATSFFTGLTPTRHTRATGA